MIEGGRRRPPRRPGNEVWPSCEREPFRTTNWKAAIFSSTLLTKIGLTVQAAVLRTNEGADAVCVSLWLSFRAHSPLPYLSSSQHKHQNISCVANVRDGGMERRGDSETWL